MLTIMILITVVVSIMMIVIVMILYLVRFPKCIVEVGDPDYNVPDLQ